MIPQNNTAEPATYADAAAFVSDCIPRELLERMEWSGPSVGLRYAQRGSPDLSSPFVWIWGAHATFTPGGSEGYLVSVWNGRKQGEQPEAIWCAKCFDVADAALVFLHIQQGLHQNGSHWHNAIQRFIDGVQPSAQ